MSNQLDANSLERALRAHALTHRSRGFMGAWLRQSGGVPKRLSGGCSAKQGAVHAHLCSAKQGALHAHLSRTPSPEPLASPNLASPHLASPHPLEALTSLSSAPETDVSRRAKRPKTLERHSPPPPVTSRQPSRQASPHTLVNKTPSPPSH